MLINHARVFLRMISKNREVFILKIFTLAVAFACSALILSFTFHEFGYDRFHMDHNSIFRMLQKNNDEAYVGNRLSNKIPPGIYDSLKKISGDTVVVSRIKLMQSINAIAGDRSFNDVKFYAADEDVTKIFSFETLDGSIKAFDTKEPTLMLSSTASETYFGTSRSEGRSLKLFTFKDTISCTVAAVYQDFPRNSHEEFNAFIRFDSATIRSLNFNPNDAGVYIKLAQDNSSDLENRLNRKIGSERLAYRLQPLSDIYFGPRAQGEDSKHGDHYSIVILICISALILFLALTSFVNLTTLTLPHRAKELAIKKLAGASNASLVIGFTKESFFVVGASMALGLMLLAGTSNLIQPILAMDLIAFLFEGNPLFLFILTGLCVFLSMSPLLVTIRFTSVSPNRLLSTDVITFPRFKRVIIFLQLGISIFLIVASMVIRRQINYSLLKEPGRNHEQVVYLRYPDNFSNADLINLRTTWKTINPNVVDLMATSQLPDRIRSKELNSDFYFLSVDPGYKDFFELQMLQGNWFKVNDGDSIMVVNEQGMHSLKGETVNVIGVFKDIGTQFNQPEKPIKINVAPHFKFNFLCIRILEVDIRRTIRFLETYFERDGKKATVSFLNKHFEYWINYQDRLNSLSEVLAIISGLLSCCAVYGLSISIVRDKLKQIAIHKLFGASTFGLTRILVKEFAAQTLMAIVFFGPVTYLVLNELLRKFVYSTPFHWMDPLVPVVYCALIIILLCGFQTLSLNREDLTSALKK